MNPGVSVARCDLNTCRRSFIPFTLGTGSRNRPSGFLLRPIEKRTRVYVALNNGSESRVTVIDAVTHISCRSAARAVVSRTSAGPVPRRNGRRRRDNHRGPGGHFNFGDSCPKGVSFQSLTANQGALSLGQRVRHAKFGEGVVLNYEDQGARARAGELRGRRRVK